MYMLTPYMAFAKKSFRLKSAYRFNHVMGIISTIVRIFIFLGIYKALYGTNTAIDGITMEMVTTNFILSIGLEAVFFVNDFYLPEKIRDGSIAGELLLPISVKGRMLADNLGNALFKLVYHFIPALMVSVFIMGIQPPAGIWNFVLFIISSLLGYGVLWSISFVVQMTSFWIINVWSVSTLKNVLVNVLSGAMIPLWFMPEWMSGIVTFSPFSSIYFTPIQIYLGQLTYKEILMKFAIQIIWITIIYSIGNVMWIKGKKKLVVQGG